MIKGLISNPLSIAGLILLGIFLLVALAAPILAPPHSTGKPYKIPRDGYSPVPKPPGTTWARRAPPLPFWWKSIVGTDQWIHIMGTSSGQWDIYYGVVWGTRTALWVGIVLTTITAVIGIAVGSISAYYGGIVDMVLMRIVDVFQTFPSLLATLTLSSILTPVMGRSLVPVMIALATFGWMGYAQLIRSEVLAIKEREYVLAARASGTGNIRILLRHILPNAIFPTLVVASMRMGDYVLTFATLSFLGIGAQIGHADWGQLLSFSRDWITDLRTYWYIVVYPGAALALFVLAWNLVGDAVRDTLDPYLYSQNG